MLELDGGFWSLFTIVHPSPPVETLRVPWLIIDPMVKATHSRSLMFVLGRPKLRTCGSSCISWPMTCLQYPSPTE